MKKCLLIGFVLMIGTFLAYSQGCSQCRLLSEQATELDENSFGSNINTGILYLMILPYLLLMFLLRKRIASFIKGLRK